MKTNWYKAGAFATISIVFAVAEYNGMPLGWVGALASFWPVGKEVMRESHPVRALLLMALLGSVIQLMIRTDTMILFFALWHPMIYIAIGLVTDRIEERRLEAEVERNRKRQREEARYATMAMEERLRRLRHQQRMEYIAMLERILRSQGFQPPPTQKPTQLPSWRKTLGVGENVTMAEVTKAYRAKAMALHQEGKAEGPMMVALNLARDEAKRYFGV